MTVRDWTYYRDQLSDAATRLGVDEMRVLVAIAARLALGRRQYGDLDIASDTRDWRREALEEQLDWLVYDTIDTLRRVDS